ncbi:hypothetical protein HNR13_003206 [Leifsonia shinshuensis]|uniref:Uncharacterized protein n=1 Tax=Leifsonia shinshuensis TaxID=150026 RepID=A0A853CXE3_9MICO|nr:hypothetical protein [Leifsonia shinshuensis]
MLRMLSGIGLADYYPQLGQPDQVVAISLRGLRP